MDKHEFLIFGFARLVCNPRVGNTILELLCLQAFYVWEFEDLEVNFSVLNVYNLERNGWLDFY